MRATIDEVEWIFRFGGSHPSRGEKNKFAFRWGSSGQCRWVTDAFHWTPGMTSGVT